ncbi:hypothetical protein G7Y89_g15004 [Cudoniella acicularis]|uniref:Heterokaryon incompatibility domain-containing protein n=1 Tax=Cudoniella acicularis TaxID=354080 RepID=A0A8H4QVJ4_9HELO|nr:hypothetical protein G7Y89_g15004 [Cudoniella acicularis]
MNSEMLSSPLYLSAPYKYEPLSGPQSIRIAELVPQRDGERIQISLHETTLQDTPAYETLSYEWGESKGSQTIACGNGTLLITTNLLAALRRLRHPTLRRHLWIDAICINQEDVGERSQQVAIMGQIYRLGYKVLIWLGETVPCTSAALAKLPELGQKQEKFETEKEDFFRECYEGKRSLDSGAQYSAFDIECEWTAMFGDLRKTELKSPDNKNCQLWQGLCDIFSRTYFERVWIIQEVVLSPTAVVLCGPHRCDWSVFCLAARYCQTFLTLPHNRILNIIIQISDLKGNLTYKHPDYYAKYFEYSGNDRLDTMGLEAMKAADLKQKKFLSSLLINFSTSKATDPSDRVWALLSLLDDASQQLLKANYALDIGHAYQKAMIAVFCQKKGLALLSKFRPPSLSRIRGAPSWVPDFACDFSWGVRIQEEEEECDQEDFWDDENDESKDTYGCALPFTIDGDILLAKGIILGSITYCTYIISPAEMCHFDMDYWDWKEISISDLNPPDMSDFTLIASAHEETIHKGSSLWLLEGSFLDVLESPNGQVALYENSTSLYDCRIWACGGKYSLTPNEGEKTDLRKQWFSEWDSINKSFQLSQSDATNQGGTEYRGREQEVWDMQNYLAKHYHWAKQNWSDQLYVHKHGRQLLKTREGWLALGPIGINSVQIGDVIVTFGDRSERFALRPLADGTYSLRARCYIQGGTLGTFVSLDLGIASKIPKISHVTSHVTHMPRVPGSLCSYDGAGRASGLRLQVLRNRNIKLFKDSAQITGVIYVIGSWHKPKEITRRAVFFFTASPLGTMFARYLQAAAYNNLDQVNRIAGWRGFTVFPDVPHRSKPRFLTPTQHTLARTRLTGLTAPAELKISCTIFKRVFEKWHCYIFVLHWTLLDQGVIPAGSPFSLYLKAKSNIYSVTQINTLPTTNTALSVVAALAAGLVLVGCVLLAVWSIGETARVAAFIITGTNGVLSPMTVSWATTLMSNDAEERAIVTASMNAIGQAISVWSQLLEYPTVQAPNFHKGFITTSVIAVLQLVNLGVIWFLSRREMRWREKAAGEEGEESNSNGGGSSRDFTEFKMIGSAATNRNSTRDQGPKSRGSRDESHDLSEPTGSTVDSVNLRVDGIDRQLCRLAGQGDLYKQRDFLTR